LADPRHALVLALSFVLLSCSSHPSARPTAPSLLPTGTSSGSLTDQSVGMPAPALDLRDLPLGSQQWSATPTVGRLNRCRLPFGGPPVRIPPWVDTRQSTWDLTRKPAVAGAVRWKSTFKADKVGNAEVLRGNGLPRQSGTFPVQPSDPAFAYNPDPSPVAAHDIDVRLPYDPRASATTSCENGVVGVAVDGVPILDGFDAGGNDADAVEVQDSCHGHPNDHSGYHYHGLSPCLLNQAAREKTVLVGWALDGFGIYVEYDAHGRLLTDAVLDGCHGRTSVVPWHGLDQRGYHYDMTLEFPYSVACFRGTPVTAAGARGLGLPPGGVGPP
jgi:hypothetical protein